MMPKTLTIRSTVACFTLLAALYLFMAPRVLAQEIFLHSYWLNAIPGPSPGMSNASIWAGGNESSGTTNGSPHSANGICLAESAIGQITAQSDGYPNASNDLAILGDSVRTNANVYRYTNFGGGLVAVPAVAWNVVFPGGFNRFSAVSGPSGPFIYPGNAASTYISNDIAEADYVLRARLEVNPADQDAAQQLVLLVDDQILPLEWAGSEAMCYSTFARLQLGPWMVNGTNTETVAVEYARGYFSNACGMFEQFLANPFNANLVEGQNPLVSAAVTNQTAQIVEDFLRNLLEYGQASLTDFQLRSTANFYDPTTSGSAPSQALLNDIDNTVNQIQMLLLLASPFQSDIPVYTASTVGQIKSLLHDLRRLHQSIILGRITFSASASGSPTGDPSLNYGEFTTAFVPFFPTQSGQNSSFYVAFNLAQSFVNYAITQESAASNDVWQVLNLQYTWTSDEVGLENQYLPQLENLCGTVTDSDGNTWADIFTAGLQSGFPTTPGPREALIMQFETNGSGLQFNYSAGTIYQQWQAVETAQTNLIKDTVSLNSTFSNMLVDTQVANAIYSNQVSLAALILTNGQQISAIDIQEGQDQAQAALAIAQIQATSAETEAENTGFGELGGFISATIGPSPGVSLNPGAITGAMATIANGYDQAAADLEIGQVQANVDTQLAALNAQIEQINANEQAQSEYVQADTTMLNLSANLASLQGQAQAQEVQIQLDAQAVDQERSKLANMMSQVGSLLEQWTRSESLVSTSPAFSSNLLVIRDATIQQANDAFALAQEWAFLAALCFNYEDNCPQDQTSYNFVQKMLVARNASALNLPLEEMQSAITLLGAGCKGSIDYDTTQFSLRNNFFQANQTSGTNITSYQPVLQGDIVLTNAAGSLSAWTNYLASHIITNGFGQRALVLNFSTSLDYQIVGGAASYNPLWNCYEFGGTLYSGQGNNGQQLYGTQVSFVTQGFTFPAGAQAGFNIGLAQNGTSVIRNRGFGNKRTSVPGFRYFNFSSFGANVTASANDLSSANTGTAAFQGRSPANTQWQLSIIANGNGGNNTALLNNLSQLTDIQLQFGVQSYTDQTAFTTCTSLP